MGIKLKNALMSNWANTTPIWETYIMFVSFAISLGI